MSWSRPASASATSTKPSTTCAAANSPAPSSSSTESHTGSLVAIHGSSLAGRRPAGEGPSASGGLITRRCSIPAGILPFGLLQLAASVVRSPTLVPPVRVGSGAMADQLPSYDQLPVVPDAPAG